MAKEIMPGGVVLDRIIGLYAEARDELGGDVAARRVRMALPRALDNESALTVLICAIVRLAEFEAAQ